MQISLRFLCVELPPGAGDGSVQVSDGATVEEALTAYAGQRDVGIPLDTILRSMFLRNKKSAGLQTVLHDKDVLTVIRTLEGG